VNFWAQAGVDMGFDSVTPHRPAAQPVAVVAAPPVAPLVVGPQAEFESKD